MHRSIIVFAKAPRLGMVKTRLQTRYSMKQVRRLYIAFVRDTIEIARRVHGVNRLSIAFTPPDGESSLQQIIGRSGIGFEWIPQQNGNLGERLCNAFLTSFHHGVSLSVIIGTDSPTLPHQIIESAFSELASYDIVLGPSTDGGFYLIAARHQISERQFQRLFDGVEWSSSHVLEQTIERGRRARLKIHLLPAWYDIDDVNSLRFLRIHLKTPIHFGGGRLAPHSARILQKI